MPLRFAPAVVALALLLVAYLPGMPIFWVSLLNLIGLASLVSLGLVILTGVGGMTSFGQAAFVGFGAYTTGLLSTQYGLSPWMTLPLALAVTGIAAVLIGLITVRLSGHYLPLGTIAWGMAIFYLFGNLEWIGGFNGIAGIPPLSIFGTPLVDARQVYPVVWIIVVIAVTLTQNLLHSRTGRAIRALRSGRTEAEAFGIHTERMKLAVFVYAALLAGLSGWLFAHIQRAVTPTAFGLNAGIEYLLMAVLGGAGHVYGAILGAGVVVILRDQLQDILPIVFGHGGNYEIIVFGLILFLILEYARQGLWPLLARKFVKAGTDAFCFGEPSPMRLPTCTGNSIELLRVVKAEKRFGGLLAVSGVSLSVNESEIVTLLGPNGAGKSTTFNLLTGVARLSAGEVWIAGEKVDGLPPRAIASRQVARTFQHVKLVPDMTVIENVALGAHLRGHAGFLRALLRLDRAEERLLFAEAAHKLELVGLTDKASMLASELSLGTSRIVEIARALCLAPRLLLLDEPAAGLRRFEKDQLASLLKTLRSQGMGILLVEHDMDFVMKLTDRIVVLNFGTQIAEGTPSEIRSNLVVQTAYLGGAA
jgi:ABC-type branched-subunit amino acid transport system ATPase component/ABC-type branched-subunit amino acid transport system permease subunit